MSLPSRPCSHGHPRTVPVTSQSVCGFTSGYMSHSLTLGQRGTPPAHHSRVHTPSHTCRHTGRCVVGIAVTLLSKTLFHWHQDCESKRTQRQPSVTRCVCSGGASTASPISQWPWPVYHTQHNHTIAVGSSSGCFNGVAERNGVKQ